MRKTTWFLLLAACALAASAGKKQKNEAPQVDSGKMKAKTFAGLKPRSLGPALTEGRIADIAVDPGNRAVIYLAVASGGVWKTVNGGTTWSAIFDDQGSYSIGCLTLDPSDPLTLWVGSGENNSQRSVGYGDGVYRSRDGGAHWQHMGLKETEHIAKILVDPRDSKVVYVAAQGPLWADGGERGLYKTTDGGATWNAVLSVDDKTGVTDLLMDPRNPDILYAATYQRRRHVWTLIDGGPGSAIHKSMDGGATWQKIVSGLPTVDLGRIGLAQSPANPNLLYAIVEAAQDKGGFFRSTNAGGSWQKQSSYVSSSPQYYQELIAHPSREDVVYSMDTWMNITYDGGKTFQRVGERFKHVDNHALWIEPGMPDHLIAGCDGGVYESYDAGATWNYRANLPIIQFYKVAADNDTPFYNVYGGTQDNFTLGGPARTTTVHGITNREWFVTRGGDGFQTRIDPENADIVYSQSQYGGLVRFDRRSGEKTDIKPQSGAGEPALRWNWDAPLEISHFDHQRLYFAANILFRSDDRGQSWRPISPDLSRNLDRNQLAVMGRVWSVDAVARNQSTSAYGNIVSLSESPLKDGLLVAGTDDGLVRITADGGENWNRIESFPGAPDHCYVDVVLTSRFDENVIFVALNNHKMGDFKPYLYKSEDRGASWRSLAGNLPERGSLYCLIQDHVDGNLLFAGTEFGLYFSSDGGTTWVALSLPTIAVRDLDIQRRENDLVIGTFGRGIYILDDYSPLRGIASQTLEGDGLLFPVRDAWAYMEATPLGTRGKGFQGDNFYAAANPPFGAVFTYYLPETLKSRAQKRRDVEAEVASAGGNQQQPSWDDLRLEDREEDAQIILTVSDEQGTVVRRLTGPVTEGFHRVAWDLRLPDFEPIDLQAAELDPFTDPPLGPLLPPGTYRVAAARFHDGQLEPFGEVRTFQTRSLAAATLPAPDAGELLAFQRRAGELQRAVHSTVRALAEAENRLRYLKRASLVTPAATDQQATKVRELEARLADLKQTLQGDATLRRRSQPTPPAIVGRVNDIVEGSLTSSSAPTQIQRDNYRIAAAAFGPLLEDLRGLVEKDLPALERSLEASGAPWTPGRLPVWKGE